MCVTISGWYESVKDGMKVSRMEWMCVEFRCASERTARSNQWQEWTDCEQIEADTNPFDKQRLSWRSSETSVIATPISNLVRCTDAHQASPQGRCGTRSQFDIQLPRTFEPEHPFHPTLVACKTAMPHRSSLSRKDYYAKYWAIQSANAPQGTFMAITRVPGPGPGLNCWKASAGTSYAWLTRLTSQPTSVWLYIIMSSIEFGFRVSTSKIWWMTNACSKTAP